MGFCRQEYWSGLPFLSPGDLHNPGIDPASLAAPVLPGRFFTTESPVKPIPSEISTFNQPKSILFPISKSLIFFCGSVAQSCPTLSDPMDCSSSGSSVHRIFQARILDWLAIFSRGSSQPRDRILVSWVSCTGRQILYHWATWVAQPWSLPPPFPGIVMFTKGFIWTWHSHCG